MELRNCIDMTGKVCGRLTVVRKYDTNKRGAYWLCNCECGKQTVVAGRSLRTGHTKSCGCLHDDLSSERTIERNRTHEMSGTRLYHIWSDMKKRCQNQNHWAFDRYGGRGISVCNEWESNFLAFHDWAVKNGYRENLTIERKNNDGNYSSENCVWVTMVEQANNKSNSTKVVFHGGKYTIAQLSRLSGISYSTLYRRIHCSGWDVEKAALTPVREGRYSHGAKTVSD